MTALINALNPTFQSSDGKFTLFQGDCNELLPKFRGEFDLIFADPPYFLSNDGLSIFLHKNTKKAKQ